MLVIELEEKSFRLLEDLNLQGQARAAERPSPAGEPAPAEA